MRIPHPPPSPRGRGSLSMVEVVAQLSRPRRMTQFAQGFGFDLANAFAGYAELAADFFERSLAAVFEAEAQLQDASLAARERVEHVVHLLFEHLPRRHVRGAQRRLIGDKVAQMTIVFGTHRDLE